MMANGSEPVVKISGYLEKKAKLRLGSPWKKYWFVLEGRLLLFYRSKDEYESLSPCKGSINLCPPCNVKPALSAAGVFQIECRASTVTLRAESRSEQERWMQALLAAIAQSKSSPNRMSHFRYSLDDLPVSTADNDNKKIENPLSRQNTMPYRISSSPKKDPKDIIERLQQMGAQTYGGSLGAITKLAHKEQKPESLKDSPNLSVKHSNSSIDVTHDVTFTSDDIQKSPTDKPSFKLPHKSESIERIPSMFVENDQYCTIQEENSIDLSLDERLARATNAERIKSLTVDNDLYTVAENSNQSSKVDENSNQSNPKNIERVTSFMLENDQYTQTKTEDESNFIRNKEIPTTEHLYERISTDSNLSDYNSKRKSGKESVSKIKYIATNLYERISSSSSNSDTQAKLNEQYSIVHKDTKEINKGPLKPQKSQENEYSLPINVKNENIDHNKNSLISDNEQYMLTADDKLKDNMYSDGLLFKPEYIEYAAIDKTKEQEGLYEDPDQLKKHQSVIYQEIEPMLPPRPELKGADSYEETISQSKKSKFKMFGHRMKSEKKSEKSNENGKTKPKQRSTSFMRRVWRRKTKSLDAEDEIYEAVDYDLIEKQVAKDKTDIQMLQELQKILETRKNILKEKLNTSESKDDSTKQSVDSKVNTITEEKEEESLEFRTVTSAEQCPSLPPRQNSQTLSPYHDIPQNYKAVESMEINNIPTKTSASNSNNDPDKICNNDQSDCKIKTIDEILEDLDKEKDIQESRQKVKQLIEKFNDIQNEEEVVLRKKTKLELCKSQSDSTVVETLKIENFNEKMNRESDELYHLLEELSKVTCAPVLTPGVTSSLVTPVLTDDEWLQLIPIRRRRMSDPDYDVPRPHRSLQLQGRTKQLADNPIPATRFFGPILPLSANDDMITTDLSSLTSMDPDSLELENLPSNMTNNNNENESVNQANTEKDYSVSSYTSHDCIKDDKVIYAHPKIVVIGTKFSGVKDNNIYSNISFINQHNSKIKENMDKCEINVKTIQISNNLGPILTKTEETFIDSLEPLAEISTAF